MTITPWELYLLLKLDDIRMLIFGLCFALITTGVCYTFIACMVTFSPPESPEVRPYIKWGAIPFILGLLLMPVYTLTPSTQQMAAIKVVPAIVNSELVQDEIPAELRSLYEQSKEALFGIKPKENGIQPKDNE